MTLPDAVFATPGAQFGSAESRSVDNFMVDEARECQNRIQLDDFVPINVFLTSLVDLNIRLKSC